MPSSPWQSISDVLNIIMALKPRPTTILDVGIGNGKYGFLCREYLHFWGRRDDPNWQSDVGYSIDGIEAFPKYIGSIQRDIYSKIMIGEASKLLSNMRQNEYDLVLLIDVLEHFDKEVGRQVLTDCSRVGKAAIISTPIAFEPQADAYGNEYERHRSLWTRTLLEQEDAAWVFNSQDRNWIAVYSDDAAYLPCIRHLSRFHRPWRRLLRTILPYQIRSAFSRFSLANRQS